jgi:hypothetical protein
MATLSGRTVASSYRELLKVSSGGLSSSFTNVEDGLGNVSPLQLSTSSVKVNGGSLLISAPATFEGTTLFNGVVTFAGNLFSQANITTGILTLTALPGTSPIQVASSTLVVGLNSDLLDGQHAPAGTIVGTTDTQTLTNKTLSGSANSFSNIPNTAITGLGTLSVQNASNAAITGGSISGVALSGLTSPLAVSSGGTGLSSVGAATTVLAPTSGGALAYKSLVAGANVTITQNDSTIQISSAGGGGGGGGLTAIVQDLVPQLGADLDVNGKKIVSLSNGNIVLEPNGTGTLSLKKVAAPSANGDAATKLYVDTHENRTDNPHSVTAGQVGNTVAQWNANQLQGRNVSAAAPNISQVLGWTGSAWAPSTPNTVEFYGVRRSGDQIFLDYANPSYLASDYEAWNAFVPTGASVSVTNGDLVLTF